MITLVPIGEVDKSVLEIVGRALKGAFGQKTLVEEGVTLTRTSWDQRRNQHLTSRLLAELSSPRVSTGL